MSKKDEKIQKPVLQGYELSDEELYSVSAGFAGAPVTGFPDEETFSKTGKLDFIKVKE